jgi:3-oxoacyl-[acyl-carrier-protein] synthase II
MAGQSSVVVTGLGAVTPLGADVASTWAGMLAGTSGACQLDTDWSRQLPVRIAAPVTIDLEAALGHQTRTLDRCQQLALLAAQEAWADAGPVEVEPERLAVVIASGIGGVITLLRQYDVLKERGARRVSPHTVPMLMPNGPAAAVGLSLRARGGVHTPVSACASGAEAIALGLDLLRAGRVDVVVCGGTEAAIAELPMAGFAAMRALSPRNDDPERASRPFDQARDGFVLGEGAGVLVLERAEHAAARGQRAHAILVGAGITSDAHHMAAPDPVGAAAARAIVASLRDGGLVPDDIVHLNAHATSTPAGDVAEAGAIRTALGSAGSTVAVSATKSTTGHLLGAAGAVEAIATVLALRECVAPPTRNLDQLDDAAALDVVTGAPRPLAPGAALSNSFGFGGHNVTLAFRSAPA